MNTRFQDTDDKALWQRISAKEDALAFAELHRRYAAKLYALAYRKLGERTAAEDIVQDLFVYFWTHRQAIVIEKEVPVYLFTSLRNRIISSLRKKIAPKAVSLDDLPAQSLLAHAANPVQEWIQHQELQALYERELSALPEKSRQAFELSRSGLTNRETAELLQITEKTVEFHISKVLRILREKVKYLVLLGSWLAP